MSASDGGVSFAPQDDEDGGLVTDSHGRGFDEGGFSSVDDENVYQSNDGSRGADDVDPRNLHRQPTASELRYYARQNAYGNTVVTKPIDDAFKYGFELENDYASAAQPFLEDEYVPVYKQAEKKARRDGFSVIKVDLRGGAPTWMPPVGDVEYDGLSVITIEDLNGHATVPEKVLDREGLTRHQVDVTENGCVVVDDITSHRNEEHLGYLIDTDGYPNNTNPFLHVDRCQHLAWNTEVDGDLGDDVWGQYEGDSVLARIMSALKAVEKGNWGMGQALFRYSAPLYALATPAQYDQDDFDAVTAELGNLNMLSSIVLPPETELTSHDGASDFDPDPFFSVLIDHICAGSELTQSVILGSEAGSVGASEADLKNYFTAIETLRNGRIEDKMGEMVRKISKIDQSTIPTFSVNYEIEWEPLFKVDQLDRAQGLARMAEAVSTGINNYILTPDEARGVLESEWAKLDHDIEMDELTEEDLDLFDRITTSKTGQHVPENEPDVGGNPRVGNSNTRGEGGVKRGSTQNNADPTSAN